MQLIGIKLSGRPLVRIELPVTAVTLKSVAWIENPLEKDACEADV
jgi:hypothetical protein